MWRHMQTSYCDKNKSFHLHENNSQLQDTGLEIILL